MQQHLLKNYHAFLKRKTGIVLPYRLGIIILITLACLLSLISLGAYINLHSWQKEEENLQNTINTLVVQHQQTGIPFIGVLDAADITARAGVTHYFSYLSAKKLEGIWLSKISINLQTKSLVIEGDGLNTADINDFIAYLHDANSPFNAWNFPAVSSERLPLQHYHFAIEGTPSGSLS
jgi:hypothetical protein